MLRAGHLPSGRARTCSACMSLERGSRGALDGFLGGLGGLEVVRREERPIGGKSQGSATGLNAPACWLPSPAALTHTQPSPPCAPCPPPHLQFDLFTKRLNKLIDMFTTIHQFSTLEQHTHIEGLEQMIKVRACGRVCVWLSVCVCVC